MKSANPRVLLITILLLISFILLPLIWNIISTTKAGGNDFIGYWSGTYLFHNGQNPYDPNLLDPIQHIQLQSGYDFTIMVWNFPTLFVFLLPLAFLSFTAAKFIWLLTNLIIMLASIFMLSRLYLSKSSIRLILIYFVFAFSLPAVILGLFMGQITFLVFLSLVTCMTLINREKWFWAGAVLILTTVKPHLAFLAVIYLLVMMVQQRQYSGLAGLFCAGVTCIIVLFIFRPLWVYDMLGILSIAPVNWATPTLGGLLHSPQISKYGSILLLPLPFLLAKYRPTISMELSVALLTVITIPFTFFGWSYDQVILLIPMAQIFGWVSQLKSKSLSFGFGMIVMVFLTINYWQRVLGIDEVYYVWVPFLWCLVFGLTWYLYHRKSGVYD